MAERYTMLLHTDVSNEVASYVLIYLAQLFGSEATLGSQLAEQAAVPLDGPEVMRHRVPP